MHSVNEILKAIDQLPPAQRDEVRQRLNFVADDPRFALAEKLRAAGVGVRTPKPLDPSRKPFTPIKLEGEPLSAQIIRERR